MLANEKMQIYLNENVFTSWKGVVMQPIVLHAHGQSLCAVRLKCVE